MPETQGAPPGRWMVVDIRGAMGRVEGGGRTARAHDRGLMTMRSVAVLLACLLAVLGAACEENRDPTTPDGALHRLRDALLARDAAALLEMASPATHRHLAELHALLEGQARRFAQDYPGEHRPAAERTYPEAVLRAKDPAALFAALIEPQLAKLDRSPGLRYGLSAVGPPTVEGDRATVATRGGETIEFVRGEDGRWRTTAFEQQLEANLARARLNQQTLEENLQVFAELRRRAAAKGSTAEAGGEPGATAQGAGGE